jgi:hypothetical protein
MEFEKMLRFRYEIKQIGSACKVKGSGIMHVVPRR